MDKIGEKDIDRLRRLGATERLQDGNEGVRLTAQFRGAPTSTDRNVWKSTLEEWERTLTDGLKPFGVQPVDGSLSMSGQTLEVIVPVKDLDAALQKLSDDEVGVRLTEERTIDPSY